MRKTISIFLLSILMIFSLSSVLTAQGRYNTLIDKMPFYTNTFAYANIETIKNDEMIQEAVADMLGGLSESDMEVFSLFDEVFLGLSRFNSVDDDFDDVDKVIYLVGNYDRNHFVELMQELNENIEMLTVYDGVEAMVNEDMTLLFLDENTIALTDTGKEEAIIDAYRYGIDVINRSSATYQTATKLSGSDFVGVADLEFVEEIDLSELGLSPNLSGTTMLHQGTMSISALIDVTNLRFTLEVDNADIAGKAANALNTLLPMFYQMVKGEIDRELADYQDLKNRINELITSILFESEGNKIVLDIDFDNQLLQDIKEYTLAKVEMPVDGLEYEGSSDEYYEDDGYYSDDGYFMEDNKLNEDDEYATEEYYEDDEYATEEYYEDDEYATEEYYEDDEYDGGESRNEYVDVDSDLEEVSADYIYYSIVNNEPVYLEGVEITGDIDFTSIFPGETSSRNTNTSYINNSLTFIDCEFNGNITAYGVEKDPESGNDIYNLTVFERNVAFIGCDFIGEAEFYAAQFSGNVDFKESDFRTASNFMLAQFDGNADFRDTEFNEEAVFIGTQFSRDASFAGSQINSGANFSAIQFSGEANFKDAFIKDKASFVGTQFSGETSFEGAEFLGISDFTMSKILGDANFTNANFDKNAEFRLTKFNGDADFTSTNFENKSSFEEAVFNSKTKFDNANFGDEADFVWTVFFGKADFKKATFNGKADFGKAIFKSDVYFGNVGLAKNPGETEYIDEGVTKFIGEANFGLTQFTGSAFFGGVEFESSAYFYGSRFLAYADFQYAEFVKAVNFGLTQFSGDAYFSFVVFNGDSSFEEALFSAKALFEESIFNKNVGFSKAQFSGYAYFKASVFNSSAFFNQVQFYGYGIFRDSVFEGDLKFNNSFFAGKANFTDVSFNGDADFTGVLLNGEEFDPSE